MITLREMSPNDLANMIATTSAALVTVLLVPFKSRCYTDIPRSMYNHIYVENETFLAT